MGRLFLYVTILSISLLLLSTCSSDRVITVRLAEEHAWETVSGRLLWYTLTYTSGDALVSVPLSVGEREVKLIVPSRRTILFTAYPLGELSPLGGGLSGNDRGGVIDLSCEEGILCSYLQRINRDWSSLIQNLSYRAIAEDVKRVDDIHYPSLLQDLVTGLYDGDHLSVSDSYSHTLDSIPSGRYHQDGYQTVSFIKGDYHPAQLPPLAAGIHTFLNHELKLVLDIIISEDEQKVPACVVRPADIIFTITQAEYHAMYREGLSFP